MNAFEILLDQDPSLTLEEQQKVLRGIVAAYVKLQQGHKVNKDSGQQRLNDNEANDLDLQLSGLDVSLRQLTNRVEVYFRIYFILSTRRYCEMGKTINCRIFTIVHFSAITITLSYHHHSSLSSS